MERKGVDSYVPVNVEDFEELKLRLITKLRPFEVNLLNQYGNG